MMSMPERSEQAIIEHDMRGQICPSCLIMALREINTRQDEIRSMSRELHILTDNRQSTSTIPQAAINMGYQVEVIKEQSWYRLKISKRQ